MNTHTHLSLSEQRNELIEQYPDLFVGAYKIVSDDDQSLELEMQEGILAIYDNRYEGLKDNLDSSITFISLNSLQESQELGQKGGEIKVLQQGDAQMSPNDQIVIAAGGVFETVTLKNRKNEKNTHIHTNLRDNGGNKSGMNKRGVVAGGFTSEDFTEEIEREHVEETPFLGTLDEKYHLCIPYEHRDVLIRSINVFLSEKYGAKNIPNEEEYAEVKRLFNINFPTLKYDDLPAILREIIDKDRIVIYQTEDHVIPGTQDSYRSVTVGSNTSTYFTQWDDTSNSYHFYKSKTITKLPDNFTPLSRRPGRLYLESKNQSARTPRIQAYEHMNPTPTPEKVIEMHKKAVTRTLNL